METKNEFRTGNKESHERGLVMQAVVLCGGEGTRLRPLTHKVPKPMIPIFGKPFLLYIVEALREQGIKDFVFLTAHLSSHIKDFFGNGKKFGVKIAYSEEKELLGTGGALKNAQNFLGNEFVLLFGDTFQEIDFRELGKKFKESGKLAMMVAYDNSDNIVAPNLEIWQGIVKKYEKGGCEGCNYVDAGIIAMRKEILELIPPGKKSLEREVYPKLIANSQLAAFCTAVRYYDIGTTERMEAFKSYLKSRGILE